MTRISIKVPEGSAFTKVKQNMKTVFYDAVLMFVLWSNSRIKTIFSEAAHLVNELNRLIHMNPATMHHGYFCSTYMQSWMMPSFISLTHQITEQQNTKTEGMDKGRKEGRSGGR